MVRTRVGYTGGKKLNPTYHSLGDHTEAVQIDFDPKVISYEKLLEVFWAAHDPTRRAWSRQYMAAVFCHDPGQKAAAEAGRGRVQKKSAGALVTAVLPAGKFYRAEGYHQKYLLRRQRRLLAELSAAYPDSKGLADSTAAARVNGYLGGHGDAAQLESELSGLGLSQGSAQWLRKIVADNGLD